MGSLGGLILFRYSDYILLKIYFDVVRFKQQDKNVTKSNEAYIFCFVFRILCWCFFFVFGLNRGKGLQKTKKVETKAPKHKDSNLN